MSWGQISIEDLNKPQQVWIVISKKTAVDIGAKTRNVRKLLLVAQ
jgi:hypothetical protein